MVNGASPEWHDADTRWLQMVGQRSSYGFLLRSDFCAPDWVQVELDGERIAHVYEQVEFPPSCQSGPCRGQKLTFEWSPGQYRTEGMLTIDDLRQPLVFLAGREADVELVATVPTVCHHVALVGAQLLCDYSLFSGDARVYEWPRSSLLVKLGEDLVGEWGEGRFRTWTTSEGGAVLRTETQVGHSPAGFYDSIEVGPNAVLLDGALAVTELAPDAGWSVVATTEFSGAVVELSGQHRLWITETRERGLVACESPDGGACIEPGGFLVSLSNEGIWFLNGSLQFGVVRWTGDAPSITELRVGDGLGPGPIKTSHGITPTAGRAFRRRSMPEAQANAFTCMTFEVTHEGLVPEVLPLGDSSSSGDGSGDLRWCDGFLPSGLPRTHVYRRRSSP